jgi:hypothetical protein
VMELWTRNQECAPCRWGREVKARRSRRRVGKKYSRSFSNRTEYPRAGHVQGSVQPQIPRSIDYINTMVHKRIAETHSWFRSMDHSKSIMAREHPRLPNLSYSTRSWTWSSSSFTVTLLSTRHGHPTTISGSDNLVGD